MNTYRHAGSQEISHVNKVTYSVQTHTDMLGHKRLVTLIRSPIQYKHIQTCWVTLTDSPTQIIYASTRVPHTHACMHARTHARTHTCVYTGIIE